ncbi:hypothetical protein HMI54_012362 [Coelomomyces lativittatus]|nr:hypothetical protein HMI56_004849 [Coelomomyces lativittatus]KAJ1498800.1 hypothetical protein HMI54_012362 [Coelomomyces lativittatus]
MEEEEQEQMFLKYVVLNEENFWEEPIFTSLSRCSSLASLDGDSSNYLSEEEELVNSYIPKNKSINLIYNPMKDSGISLDPAHGCATALKAKPTSKKRNRNDQASYSSLTESNGTEKKKKKEDCEKSRECSHLFEKVKERNPS